MLNALPECYRQNANQPEIIFGFPGKVIIDVQFTVRCMSLSEISCSIAFTNDYLCVWQIYMASCLLRIETLGERPPLYFVAG